MKDSVVDKRNINYLQQKIKPSLLIYRPPGEILIFIFSLYIYFMGCVIIFRWTTRGFNESTVERTCQRIYNETKRYAQ